MWGAHWSILLESRGVPTVFLVDEPFQADVQTTCEKEGAPMLRRVVIPHPCGDVSDEQLKGIVPKLVSALTAPLKPEKRNPKASGMEAGARIVFKGNLEEVNRFFYEKGWTDGLPIFPPTEEKVREMLRGTSHGPEEIVTAGMLPEGLTVSVEKVAVVGAMAGCDPSYMPVLLSMVEAFANEFFSSSVRSTTSFAFAGLVNGPIIKEVGMNAGINALGSGTGNKANATIGRFLRLSMICLGDSRSGVSDMSSQGNPAKYSFAFAENEEKSPWEPFHVSLGYRPQESVVSILSGGWNHNGPFGNVDLKEMAESISTYALPNGVLIVMDPMSANKLAAEGYGKQDVEEFIWSHARNTIRKFKADFFYPMFIEAVLKGKSWYGKKGYWPSEYLDLQPDEVVPIYPREEIRVIIVGGETNPFTQVWQMARPSSVVIDKWR